MRERGHQHYLSGKLFCHTCDSRWTDMQVKRRRYRYFFCPGRHLRRTECGEFYMPAEDTPTLRPSRGAGQDPERRRKAPLSVELRIIRLLRWGPDGSTPPATHYFAGYTVRRVCRRALWKATRGWR
jgi:hypothetical protein